MKFYIQIILLFVSANITYGQSKKSLLKEIQKFEYKNYINQVYAISSDSLKFAIKSYFKNEGYHLKSDTDLIVVACKNKRVACTTYPQHQVKIKGSYEECTVKLCVSVQIKGSKNEGKEMKINTKAISDMIMYGRRQLGEPHFNELGFYKYVFRYIYHKMIQLPEELQIKINHYNQQQSKDSKKILYEI